MTRIKFHGLDPCHYFSSPGLSWDTILKMIETELEKISDIDKYLFIEKGLRRVISYIAKSYAKVGDVKKLIPSLGSKTNDVVHYKNLQLYLSLKMKLTKIHRLLKFKQSHWMSKYIGFNDEKRNDFEKDFF